MSAKVEETAPPTEEALPVSFEEETEETSEETMAVITPSPEPTPIPSPEPTPQTQETGAKANAAHVVKKGDTLGSIAKKYHVTVKQLKQWNGLKNDFIREGQKVCIGAI